MITFTIGGKPVKEKDFAKRLLSVACIKDYRLEQLDKISYRIMILPTADCDFRTLKGAVLDALVDVYGIKGHFDIDIITEDEEFLPTMNSELERMRYYYNTRVDELKEAYKLAKHPEGGWFSEVYTAPFSRNNRALAGSIYFLLDGNEISHFHQIDCDEIWYFHEGCGLKIIVLVEDGKQEYFLGSNVQNGENHMILIPKGAIFGAKNLDKDGYTFVSCVTTPKFRYDGFRLVGKREIREKYMNIADEIEHLAYEE